MSGGLLERELWLRADTASVPVARAFVGEVAQDLRYDPPSRQGLQLAVTEAVANAVEHGAPCEGLIAVSAYLEEESLTTEVSDCGHFDTARPVSDKLGERGRGLQLMAATVDRVEIDAVPGRTVVRLKKRLPS